MNAADNAGMTPLHMAVKFPKLDLPMVRLLLENGCDPLNLHAFTKWLLSNNIIPEDQITADEDFAAWLRHQETSVPSLKNLCRLELQRALSTSFSATAASNASASANCSASAAAAAHVGTGASCSSGSRGVFDDADSLRARALRLPLPPILQTYISLKAL